jgi:hypothetical protein
MMSSEKASALATRLRSLPRGMFLFPSFLLASLHSRPPLVLLIDVSFPLLHFRSVPFLVSFPPYFPSSLRQSYVHFFLLPPLPLLPFLPSAHPSFYLPKKLCLSRSPIRSCLPPFFSSAFQPTFATTLTRLKWAPTVPDWPYALEWGASYNPHRDALTEALDTDLQNFRKGLTGRQLYCVPTVEGSLGIGKTRLVFEAAACLRARLASDGVEVKHVCMDLIWLLDDPAYQKLPLPAAVGLGVLADLCGINLAGLAVFADSKDFTLERCHSELLRLLADDRGESLSSCALCCMVVLYLSNATLQ